MARSSLRRKPRPNITWAEVHARQLFIEAAREQRCCAKCGKAGGFEAHHVIERRYLKANRLPQFVSLNALRLCSDCHAMHTCRSEPLELKHLTDENIEYAFTLLGDKADSYLRSLYSGEDDRLSRAVEELNGSRR